MATSEILLEETPYLNLTTRGRRTGLHRSVELWFAYEEGKLLFLAHEDSNWWKNIERNPTVEVEVSEILFQGRGRVAQEKLDHVFALFRKKYGSNQVDRWYGEQRGQRRSVEIDLVKVLGKRPIQKLSMEIST